MLKQRLLPMDIYIQNGYENIQAIMELFVQCAQSLGFCLDFQNFDAELGDIEKKYRPPDGRLYLAMVDGEPVGCVALRKLTAVDSEMKRLYVRPNYRGMGVGMALCQRLIADAKEIGYANMLLDSVKDMESAIELYEKLGFKRIPAYYDNPHLGAIYMSLNLKGESKIPKM
jgi:ribosomal protein S18 acetylase RimI-like enzyme